MTNGTLTTLDDLHVWLGRKNSDDQGTRFDVRAELYKNGMLAASGETHSYRLAHSRYSACKRKGQR